MMKKELSATMIAMSAMIVPLIAQADQPMSGRGSTDSNSTYLPGEKVKKGQIPAGYNETASYNCLNPWKLLLTADYIYWSWQQEMMQVGTLIEPTAVGAASFLNGQGDVILQTPGYASGFQVGLGCNLRGMDDWNVYADYTWYKNTSDLHTV